MNRRTETAKDYQERINKVILYIQTHLYEKLDVLQLAHYASFSQYHFHRIMKAHLNESLISFIIRTRMETAAGLLLYSEMKVADIAYKVGYDVPSSFNKAFKKRFGVAPSAYKDHYNHSNIFNHIKKSKAMKKTNLQHETRDVSSRKVIYVTSIGPYDGKGTDRAWEKVCRFGDSKGLMGEKTEFIGISYDDPKITEKEKLRYEACITTEADVSPEGEVGLKEIPGGKYEVFLHPGPYTGLSDSYDFIFGEWLPGSNRELRDEPCFEVYLNAPENTKPEDLRTEIWVPVK